MIKFINKKIFLTFFSLYIIGGSLNEAMAIPPELLTGEELNKIRARQGKFIDGSQKQYGIWAFHDDEEQRLGVLCDCPFLNVNDLDTHYALRTIQSHSNYQTMVCDLDKVDNVDEFMQEVMSNVIADDFLTDNAPQVSVTCGAEASNPFMNPDTQSMFEEDSRKGVVETTPHIEQFNIVGYRLFNSQSQPLKDFLLVHLGKGYLSSSNNAFSTLMNGCTALLQEAEFSACSSLHPEGL